MTKEGVQDFFLVLGTFILAAFAAVVVGAWILLLLALQVFVHYLPWILICATALTLGYWYL